MHLHRQIMTAPAQDAPRFEASHVLDLVRSRRVDPSVEVRRRVSYPPVEYVHGAIPDCLQRRGPSACIARWQNL